MAKTFLEQDLEAELGDMEEEEGKGVDEEEGESDSGDEMEDDDELDAEALKKVNELEAEVTASPYHYEAQYNLVNLLRKGTDFNKLRACRENFNKYFPLSPDLWIHWTQDERKIATTPDEKEFVIQLFERGVKDYVSVELWLEYCQHCIGGIGTEEGIKKAREVYERSATACSMNVGKGSLVWESYREFEAALLSLPGGDQSEQRGRVLNLFRRQLRLPLLGMEKTLEEYKQFVEGNEDQNIIRDYQKALVMLKAREGLEVRLLENESSLEAYREYIALEMKEKDPARIQCIFERCITDHCLEASIWQKYLGYLDSALNIETVSLPVYTRAIRNCPWSEKIWCNYIRSLERFGKEHKEVVRVFEEALGVGFSNPAAYLEVWLAYLDYMRRRTEFSKEEETPTMTVLRTIFDRAAEHLASVEGDPNCEVLKYYANVEADRFRNMERARKIWADIVQIHQFEASFWLEFIQLEKIFGDRKHLRKRYERAMEKTHDQPELIAKSWIQFEREEGSLEAFDACQKAINIKMEKVTARREKENMGKEEEEKIQNEKVERKKEKDKQYRREQRQLKSQAKQQLPAGGKPAATPAAAATPRAAPGFKVPSLPGGGAAASPAKRSSSGAVAPPPGYVAPPPGYKPPPTSEDRDGGSAAKRPRLDMENLTEDERKKLRTVFLSNLDFGVTEEDIGALMGTTGPIVEVRLVKHPNGKSKGFAFVEYETYDQAQAALKRDNEPLNGRPVYISECDPEKRKSFKYNVGLEKKKLFVKGIDLSVTKAELVELFSQFGKLADLRLVTYRNGHSKGLAFVDFEEEVGAAAALIKTDGMQLKDKVMEVAISNPPKRKDEGGDFGNQGVGSSDTRSLGGTQQKEFGPRGKGRTQVAFMPRSISIPSKPDKKLAPIQFVKPGGGNSDAKPDQSANGNGTAGGQDQSQNGNGSAAKSNSDFRQMILGSK